MKNGEDELFNLLENTPVHDQNGVSLKAIYEHTDLFWSYSFNEIIKYFKDLIHFQLVKGRLIKSGNLEENWEFLGILY